MPSNHTAAGDLVSGESPSTATTLDRSAGPGLSVTAGAGAVREPMDRPR